MGAFFTLGGGPFSSWSQPLSPSPVFVYPPLGSSSAFLVLLPVGPTTERLVCFHLPLVLLPPGPTLSLTSLLLLVPPSTSGRRIKRRT